MCKENPKVNNVGLAWNNLYLLRKKIKEAAGSIKELEEALPETERKYREGLNALDEKLQKIHYTTNLFMVLQKP
jgi:predicted  nucleic acid-binding Zn-ribbon protein